MKEFLKQKLLENKPKVYSLIVHYYADTIEQLGCSVFKNWLCEELDIEEGKINMASLYSAARRMQQKNKPGKKKIDHQLKMKNENNSSHFFTNPDTLPSSGNNIMEM
jgi:hypothetical protein